MKIFLVILAFFFLSFGSTYWYVCKIKFLCDDSTSETIVSQVEIAIHQPSTVIDSSIQIPIIDSLEFVEALPDSATTKKINYNKSFNFVFKRKSPDYNSDAELEKNLKELASFSKANPSAKIMVIGHTDNMGAADSNMILGQSRADAIMKKLYSYGASSGVISASSKGELESIATNETDEGRKINRRVQIIVKN